MDVVSSESGFGVDVDVSTLYNSSNGGARLGAGADGSWGGGLLLDVPLQTASVVYKELALVQTLEETALFVFIALCAVYLEAWHQARTHWTILLAAVAKAASVVRLSGEGRGGAAGGHVGIGKMYGPV